MHEIFYRYRVHRDQARAFEEAYGPTGPWAKLFARQPGFVRTRLFRHKEDPGIYVTIDSWQTKRDYVTFKRTHAAEYRRLNEQFALLTLEQDVLRF